jgi:A/G-specific adenine glycosylase
MTTPDAPLPAEADSFRAALRAWFRKEGRDYPWRRTRDPYAILVSEVMLQQTQIATVLGRGYYARWMQTFPDLPSLAAAEEPAVLKAWEGLGYYRRARNLQAAARMIIERHGGTFPRRLEQMAALPGVGRYTAGAVVSFAFNQPAPIVDGNIARVLARLFHLRTEINTPPGQRVLWSRAETLLDRKHPRLHNSALMELGQRICTVSMPACAGCPVRGHCRSAGLRAGELPRRKPARATVRVEEHVLWMLRRGRLLLAQETGARRTGLWRLPERTAAETHGLPVLAGDVFSITHHRVRLLVHKSGTVRARPGEVWHALDTLSLLAMPGPYRRVTDRLLAGGIQ